MKKYRKGQYINPFKCWWKNFVIVENQIKQTQSYRSYIRDKSRGIFFRKRFSLVNYNLWQLFFYHPSSLNIQPTFSSLYFCVQTSCSHWWSEGYNAVQCYNNVRLQPIVLPNENDNGILDSKRLFWKLVHYSYNTPQLTDLNA